MAWRPSWSCDQHHVIKFSFSCTWKLTYKIWLKWPSGFLETKVLIFICKCPGAKDKKWHWPSILTYFHKFNKMSAPTNFQVTGCNRFSEKIHCFHFFFLQKSLCYQSWPCRKIGQGQPRVIIGQTIMGWSPRCYIPSFVEIGPPVSGKKIFWVFLPYMGVAAILVMWPRCHDQNFVPPYPRRLNIKFGFDPPSGFLWTKCLSIVDDDGRTDADGQTTDHGYTISSPISLRLRLANKM